MNILFQGDSITDCGWDRNHKEPNIGLGHGYVNLIASRLNFESDKYNIYNRGVSGNRICDMYARWIENTLNIEYDILSILCGINDVGFGLRLNMGADADKFRFVYDRMIYEAFEKRPGSKLVLLEPFLFRVDLEGKENNNNNNDIYVEWDKWSGNIRERGVITKDLAKKYNAIFVPLFDGFEKLSEKFGADHWSADGIHPSHAGHEYIARQWIDCCKEIL